MRARSGSGARRWRIVSRTPSGIRSAGDLRRVVEAALGAQQPHDLVDEERVALGRLVDRAHDAVGRAAAGDALDDLGDVALAQPAQRQPLAVADDVAERRRRAAASSRASASR